MKNLIYSDWLVEQDLPAAPADPVAAPGAPPLDPGTGTGAAETPPMSDPNQLQQTQPAQPPAPEEEDISNDPQSPDMPEEQQQQDFETWKFNFIKESIKGDVIQLKSMLSQVKGRDLDVMQRKFVKDNWNIVLLREYANINATSKDIRRMMKEQLDRNNPATSVVNYMTTSLESHRDLLEIFIKLNGYGGLKGDLHRKFVAALLGAVQLGSGSGTASSDINYYDKEYTMFISTRFNATWGDVGIGPWNLKQDDPSKYLSDPEQDKLTDGSPEERDVLRRRVVIESIAEKFETRAFIINVVGDDGTIYFLGWDIAGSLRNAYGDGKILVETNESEESEAMIDEDGNIVPALDWVIYYVKDTGTVHVNGKPQKKKVPFMRKKNGMLFLVADMQTIRDASAGLSGIAFKEMPYQGNPSDLPVVRDCVYSAFDLLLRQC